MRRLLLPFFCVLATVGGAQVPDFIAVRKPNGRTIKSFTAGSPISLITKSGIPLSGTIQQVKRDTLYISTFNIRVVMTNLGVTVVDTFARRVERIPFQHIGRIAVFSRQRSLYRKAGGLMKIGGGGYLLLNGLNAAFDKERITKKENLANLGTAAVVAVSGALLQRVQQNNHYSRRRHRIVYVALQ